LWKSLGIVLLVLGITEVVGAAAGGDYWLRPLSGLTTAKGAGSAEEHMAFQRIKSLGDLERALETARAESRPVMLDFYADWCVECIRMERNTFPEPQVQAEFERFDLLQADVTANDDLDQALMKAFGIIGPPAILFFDAVGEEMKAYRLVGYFEADEFAAHLQKVLVAK
jgi:thiol:disulfide interchange protein DsbD